MLKCTVRRHGRHKGALEKLESLSFYGESFHDRKPSKAQRRRQKKHQELRERERLLDEARGRVEGLVIRKALRCSDLKVAATAETTAAIAAA